MCRRRSSSTSLEVPEPLAAVLEADDDLKATWESLSYTRRKELARGIAEAKQATRDRRMAKAIEDLRPAVLD